MFLTEKEAHTGTDVCCQTRLKSLIKICNSIITKNLSQNFKIIKVTVIYTITEKQKK